MSTVRDIARRAGVSTATVSNVLNDTLYVSAELRGRVLKAASELNYQPNTVARSLRMKRSNTVGIIVPDVTNPFFPALVRGAEDTLTRAGFTLILGNSDNDASKEDAYCHSFLKRQVDGLLMVPSADVASSAIKVYPQRGIPVVYADRAHVDMSADVVLADNLRGSEICVDHLVATGRRRIATITGPLHLANARARLDGYRQALKKARLPIDPALIRKGAYDIASGLQQAQILIDLADPPDAVFVANGLMTCGALQAILDRGMSCPGDVALASFDRLAFFDLLRPRLTGVQVSPYELGTRAAELLIRRMQAQPAGRYRQYVLPPELVQRESTACPGT